MYIKTDAPAYKPGGFKTPEMDEAVSFDADGKARVTKDVGEFLAENFDHISIDAREGEDDDTESDASDDDSSGDIESDASDAVSEAANEDDN